MELTPAEFEDRHQDDLKALEHVCDERDRALTRVAELEAMLSTALEGALKLAAALTNREVEVERLRAELAQTKRELEYVRCTIGRL